MSTASMRPSASSHAPDSSEAMISARALIVGERINTSGLERADVYSTAPFSFRGGERGFVAVFRYGVVVLIGLAPLEEDETLRSLAPRVSGPFAAGASETIRLRLAIDAADQPGPDGIVNLKSAAPEHLLVVADALAKSVALDHDERQVARVFDGVEPFAHELAERGRAPGGRRAMFQLIGSALRVKARVAGRVAALEKPDVLWDRPDLDRLYARLEDEFEIRERAEALNQKLEVLGETATALTDLVQAERSMRLEMIIIALIAVEILFTIYDLWLR